MTVTPEQLAEIKARNESANKMVSALCTPRGLFGHREWMMSIPAQPDHDPDLVISASLHDVPALIAEVERLTKMLQPRTFPHVCECCSAQIESADDYDYHGLGNCVDVCGRCSGSGIEPEEARIG